MQHAGGAAGYGSAAAAAAAAASDDEADRVLSGLAAAAFEGHGGAAAAAARSRSLRSDSSVFRVLRGGDGEQDWEVLSSLSRADARDIAAKTGLPIRFGLGQSRLEVVTRLDDLDPNKFCMGRGESGVFCPVRSQQTGEFAGVKLSKKGPKARREAQMHDDLVGVEGVLQPIARIESEGEVCQVMELAGFGSIARLKSSIKELADPTLRRQFIYHIAKGILTAVQNLHDRDRFHLDLKPSNVVVDAKGRVLLVDFDCAQQLEERQVLLGEASGDIRYSAPERMRARWGRGGKHQADVIDSWAIGLILYELVSDAPLLDVRECQTVFETPFDQLSPDLRRHLQDMERAHPVDLLHRFIEMRLDLENSVEGRELREVLSGLLQCRPEKRMIPGHALLLPWFKTMEDEVRRSNYRQHLQELVFEEVLHRASHGDLNPSDLPRVPPEHVFRKKLEPQVRASLLDGSQRMTVLAGAPGTGKSYLAAWFVNQADIIQAFPSIFWLRNCASKAHIDQELILLARGLGFGMEEPSAEDAVRFLKEENDLSRTLIVLDRAEKQEHMAHLVELGAHLLITTNRMEEWKGAISVRGMLRGEGEQLIEKHLGRREEIHGELALRVAYIPLALVQACAYIRQEGCFVREYLNKFHDEEVLGSNRPASGYLHLERSIREMCSHTVACLERMGALPTLRAIACLASQPLPKELAAHFQGQAIRQLHDYSVIEISDAGGYSLHEMNREHVLGQLSEADRIQALGEAMKAVHRSAEAALANPSEHPISSQALYFHSLRLLEHAIKLASVPTELAKGCAHTITIFINCSLSLGMTVEKSWLELGDRWGREVNESDERVRVQEALGDGWRSLDEHQRAIEAFGSAQEALGASAAAPGLDLLRIRQKLANACRASSDLDGAEATILGVKGELEGWPEERLRSKEVALFQADVLSSLGKICEVRGRPDEAIRHHQAARRLYKLHIGHENDPRVGLSLAEEANSLTSSMSVGADGARALRLYRDAVTIFQKSGEISQRPLGVCHYNLARLHFDMEKWDEVIQSSEEALRCLLASCGENHGTVVECRYHLGIAYYRKERFEEARVQLAAAVQSSQATFGSTPKEYLRALEIARRKCLSDESGGEAGLPADTEVSPQTSLMVEAPQSLSLYRCSGMARPSSVASVDALMIEDESGVRDNRPPAGRRLPGPDLMDGEKGCCLPCSII